jgi:hypothetical protein
VTITTAMWNASQARIAALEKTVLSLSKIVTYLYPRALLDVADPSTAATEAQYQTLVDTLPKT